MKKERKMTKYDQMKDKKKKLRARDMVQVHIKTDISAVIAKLAEQLQNFSEISKLRKASAASMLSPLVGPKFFIVIITLTRRPVLVQLITNRVQLINIEFGTGAILGPLGPQTMNGGAMEASLSTHEIVLITTSRNF